MTTENEGYSRQSVELAERLVAKAKNNLKHSGLTVIDDDGQYKVVDGATLRHERAPTDEEAAVAEKKAALDKAEKKAALDKKMLRWGRFLPGR